MAFVKAKKEKIWTKILLGGSSGSGKTYSALRLATGLAKKCGSGIAAIDTEAGRIRYYANEFDFSDMQLTEPFTPEKYIEAINDAVDSGFKVLIIDSISHEWNYCVDIHDKMPGNSWTNWSKVTPRHDAFMEKILQAPIHIIATVRGKDEYVLEEKNGKQTPKKVGLGFKQRDGVEYNYTATFNIAQDTHIAEATKDNTHIFEGRYEVLTEKDGEALYDWANTGEDFAFNIPKAQDDIIKLATELGGSKDPEVKASTIDILKEANPKNCTNEALLKQSLNALNSLKASRGGSK
ncbi:MAG: AAA family ATPase [Candidatus Coprovivens sp.]